MGSRRRKSKLYSKIPPTRPHDRRSRPLRRASNSEQYWQGLGGFTLIELLVSVALVGTLAAIGIPIYADYLDRARNAVAISDINNLQDKIHFYELEHDKLPDDLSNVNWVNPDPWGHPYQYLNFAAYGAGWKGKARKDRFLVPLNSSYDLYSKGKDGQSKAPLTPKESKDDILRANDGGFIGLASMF
jgi:general secretion pathway protein G